jgi:hypothetical protein
LDALDATKIDYVAFLDSDDYWYSPHLQTGLRHLASGDFYFANCMTDDGDHFKGAPFIRRHHNRIADGIYEPVDGTVPGADFRRALLEWSFLSTSEVVYRYRTFSSFRFDTEQRRAGEDFLFWLVVGSACKQVAYSTKPMGYRGRGVSIHRQTLSWESVNAADRLIDELKVLRKADAFSPDRDASEMLNDQTRRLRDELMVRLLRLMKRHPVTFARTLVNLMREFPEYFLHAPMILLRTPSIVKQLRAGGSPGAETLLS